MERKPICVMAEFASLIDPILEAAHVSRVCEIRSQFEADQHFLHKWLVKTERKLYSLLPEANEAYRRWLASVQPHVEHIPGAWQEKIATLPAVDAWFLDSDFNWYTVANQLNLIRDQCAKHQKPYLVFISNVGWPWGHRDLYQHPEQINEQFRQPYSWEEGVAFDHPGVTPHGYRPEGRFAIAKKEGGLHNGVLAGIEDFTHNYGGEFCYASIPGNGGLGILFNLQHPHANEIAQQITPFNNHPYLQYLENQRLATLQCVLQLQHEKAQHTAHQALPNLEDPETLLKHFEEKAVALSSFMSEEHNGRRLWQEVHQQIKVFNPAQMDQFTQYIGMLLTIPQDPQALKMLTLLEAMSSAYSQGKDQAKLKLQQLLRSASHDESVQEVLTHLDKL